MTGWCKNRDDLTSKKICFLGLYLSKIERSHSRVMRLESL